MRFRVFMDGEVAELDDRRLAADLARRKCKTKRVVYVDGPSGRWRPLKDGGWVKIDLGYVLAVVGMAAALDRHPCRQAIALELVSRPWGALPPPWLICVRDGAGYEAQYERLCEANLEKGLLPEQAKQEAAQAVIRTMKRAGEWPLWMREELYERSRERIARRLGLIE